MKNFEVFEAIKWFYLHELELFKLEKKEELTDEENLHYLKLNSKMMSTLRLLQKELIKPCKEILDLMIYRLKFLNNIFDKRIADLKMNKKEITKERSKGKYGWNHLDFIEKAIPRMKKNLKSLKKASTYSELKVAVDIMVNEIHYGYPIIKHITRHLTNMETATNKKEKADAFSKELVKLRNKMRKERIKEKDWVWER